MKIKQVVFLLSFVWLANYELYAQDVTPPIIAKSIHVGTSYESENYHISFHKVLTDSRCPRVLTCVWPGGVEVEVEVFNRLLDETEIIKLNIDNPEINDKKILQLNEKLSLYFHNLRPYPQHSNMEISKDAYQLVFYEKQTID